MLLTIRVFFLNRLHLNLPVSHASSIPTSPLPSNGTFVNDSKVGKKNSLALKAEDEIALYRPQGVSPLGMPIVYKLELHEESFAQVTAASIN